MNVISESVVTDIYRALPGRGTPLKARPWMEDGDGRQHAGSEARPVQAGVCAQGCEWNSQPCPRESGGETAMALSGFSTLDDC